MIELRNPVVGIKHSIEGLNNGMEKTEESIGEP